MARFALRVGRLYPYPKYRGDVIPLGNSSREQVEDIRNAMATGQYHDVVQLDDAGDVMHRTVTSEGGTRYACLDCPATSRNRPPTGPCTPEAT